MATGAKARKGMSIHSLWENPLPTGSFNAQTVAVDLSKYSGALIQFATSDGSNLYYSTMICLKNGARHALVHTITGSGTIRTRWATLSDTGIVFSTGYSGSSTSTNSAVPQKIYGIRGL